MTKSLKNKQFFTIDDYDELTSDHIFYSHLAIRNNLISELGKLDTNMLNDHLDKIQYQDDYLTAYRKARIDLDIVLAKDILEYKRFDIKAYKNRKDVTDARWAIADDLRKRKEDGEFNTYMDAYRWAEKNLTQNGKPLKADDLESAFYKAKSEGKVD